MPYLTYSKVNLGINGACFSTNPAQNCIFTHFQPWPDHAYFFIFITLCINKFKTRISLLYWPFSLPWVPIRNKKNGDLVNKWIRIGVTCTIRVLRWNSSAWYVLLDSNWFLMGHFERTFYVYNHLPSSTGMGQVWKKIWMNF